MKKKFRFSLILVTALLVLAGCSSFKTDNSRYYLYTPKDTKSLPLVIVFHGYGEAENAGNTKVVSTLTSTESQSKHSCYVLAPHIDDNIFLAESNRLSLYAEVKEISDHLIAEGKVNPSAVYCMGNSFGGLATVEFLETYPEDIAGAIVMCPALTYSRDSSTNLSKIKDIPIWFAHATNDNVIPVDVSRSAVSTLKAMGAENVSLTEFSDQEMLSAGALTGFHQADFAVMADDRFMEWLFSLSCPPRP
ncbi:alpha/beta hydrolase [Butyrivibrio sp. VCB2001]|uniref:carboxylesterase family protein n=1 Tax=Butyrivibrio sp. VCB2001 TaxID=1280667 RepID=UPI0003FD78BA|nr:alpha/beta hydrolase [Butyrivibrio sp. VCB2001]